MIKMVHYEFCSPCFDRYGNNHEKAMINKGNAYGPL